MSYIPAPRRRPRPDFTLTIVNVVFLLLLFFLAAGTLVSRSEFETNAPVTFELPLERLPRPLLLVTENGALLDGREVEGADLVDAARTSVEAASGSFLNILANKNMPARQFLDTVAEVGRAGVPLRIVTLRQSTERIEGP